MLHDFRTHPRDLKRCSRCHEFRPLTEFIWGRWGWRPCMSCLQSLAAQRASQAAHDTPARAASRAWKAAHPEWRRADSHRRRVRIRGGFVEKVDEAELYKRCAGRCEICGKPIPKGKGSIDHILPVSKGGEHSYANTRLVHLRCNISRGNRDPAQLRLLG